MTLLAGLPSTRRVFGHPETAVSLPRDALVRAWSARGVPESGFLLDARSEGSAPPPAVASELVGESVMATSVHSHQTDLEGSRSEASARRVRRQADLHRQGAHHLSTYDANARDRLGRVLRRLRSGRRRRRGVSTNAPRSSSSGWRAVHRQEGAARAAGSRLPHRLGRRGSSREPRARPTARPSSAAGTPRAPSPTAVGRAGTRTGDEARAPPAAGRRRNRETTAPPECGIATCPPHASGARRPAGALGDVVRACAVRSARAESRARKAPPCRGF